jgi:hypothetical protein
MAHTRRRSMRNDADAEVTLTVLRDARDAAG